LICPRAVKEMKGKSMRTGGILLLPVWCALVACNPGTQTATTETTPVAPAPVATETPAPAPETSSRVAAALPSLAPMLKRVEPSVVNISVEGTVQVQQNPLFKDPMFRQFFHLPQNTQPTTEHVHAVGSGVIYDAKHGYVLTNNHVIEDADKIQVTLSDGRQLAATKVASDPGSDVAVLKIPPDNLTQLPLGHSKNLQVGDYVVAIGDPFGVGQAATFGIVSALGRNNLGIEGYEDFIQTDASINPGNSGGALIDMNGRLIGINTAILTKSNGNQGVGFAIPIDMADSVAKQLLAHGKIVRGELGVALQDLTPTLASAMGIKATTGVLISDVRQGTAADQAGLKVGDVVVAVDGVPVTTSGQMKNAVGAKQPGQKLALTILRNGSKMDMTATLHTPKEEQKTADAASPVAAHGPESPLSGLTLAPIPPDNKLFGKVTGLYVQNIRTGSGAEEAGLQQGDIITSIDKKPVSTPQDIARVVQAQKSDKPVLLRVQRGESAMFLAVG
jgi:serine protease Do